MTNTEERWRACPQGELGRLGARLRGRRRRRFAVRATGVLAVLLTCTALWTVAARDRENHFAGLSCTEVSQLAMAYGEGKLDAELSGRVRSHVDQCRRCHDRYREMGLITQLIPPPLIRLVQVAFHHPPGPPGSGTSTRSL
jgi:hypothetical protein